MGTQEISAAMQRVESVLRRRPGIAIHDDAQASARFVGGMRCVTSHENGTQVSTDMPVELGGTGDQVSPGCLFRAGLAACMATTIVMAAAAEGIDLTRLEVDACSRSDTRGILAMSDEAGHPGGAGPLDLRMHVRISAAGVPAERLRALVEQCRRRSPVPCIVEQAMPIEIRTEAG